MTYNELTGKSIREGFAEFHAANPHVYEAFERQCRVELAAGAKRISPKRIMNDMRWGNIKTEGDQFKVNDAHISYYARLFVEKNPEYKAFVPMRKLRNEVPGPYMKVGEHGQIEFF